jgi:hypothetical protein
MQLYVEDTCVDCVDNPWRGSVCVLIVELGSMLIEKAFCMGFILFIAIISVFEHVTVYGNTYWSIRELPFRLWNII